jgi:transposase
MKLYGLRDDQFVRIEMLLPGLPRTVGRNSDGGNRLFVEAVIWKFRSGAPWRDLPERFGAWKNIHTRFSRWAKSGVWESLFKALAEDPDNEYAMIDATITQAEQLTASLAPNALLADKGYDADRFIESLQIRGITVVIPPKSNRKVQRDCDFALYAERNLVERFFNNFKHFRGIATRYEKTGRNFLACFISSARWLGLIVERP